MPHKRKIRKDNETKLLFEPDESFLFLAYTGVSSDSLLVPLDTLVTLSILKYIGADLKVLYYWFHGDDFFTLPEISRIFREIDIANFICTPPRKKQWFSQFNKPKIVRYCSRHSFVFLLCFKDTIVI